MTQKHGYHPVHIRGYGVLVAPQHVLTAHHCFDTIRLTSPAARQAVDIAHRKVQPLIVSPSHLITISAVDADDLGIIWLPLPMDSDPATMSPHKTSSLNSQGRFSVRDKVQMMYSIWYYRCLDSWNRHKMQTISAYEVWEPWNDFQGSTMERRGH